MARDVLVGFLFFLGVFQIGRFCKRLCILLRMAVMFRGVGISVSVSGQAFYRGFAGVFQGSLRTSLFSPLNRKATMGSR